MISVLASIRVKEGQRAAFLDIFNANIPKVIEESGCIEYFAAVDLDAGFPVQLLDENVVTIIEKWQSLDALKDHSVAPHMREYRKKIQALVEGTSLKVLQKA